MGRGAGRALGGANKKVPYGAVGLGDVPQDAIVAGIACRSELTAPVTSDPEKARGVGVKSPALIATAPDGEGEMGLALEASDSSWPARIEGAHHTGSPPARADEAAAVT